jgi:hypothetical protein
MNDKLTATMQIAKRVHSMAQEQNESALMIGAYRALAGTFFFSGDFEAARKYAMVLLLQRQCWSSDEQRAPAACPSTQNRAQNSNKCK